MRRPMRFRRARAVCHAAGTQTSRSNPLSTSCLTLQRAEHRDSLRARPAADLLLARRRNRELERQGAHMERKAARSSQKLTNEFLQESKLDEFEAVAVKEEL